MQRTWLTGLSRKLDLQHNVFWQEKNKNGETRCREGLCGAPVRDPCKVYANIAYHKVFGVLPQYSIA